MTNSPAGQNCAFFIRCFCLLRKCFLFSIFPTCYILEYVSLLHDGGAQNFLARFVGM
jgi:hypothetical protein